MLLLCRLEMKCRPKRTQLAMTRGPSEQTQVEPEPLM